MSKKIKVYFIYWVVLVVLFNVICFVIPDEINGVSKFAGSFWVGYIFILITFVAHLLYAFWAFSITDKQKIADHTSVTVISFVEFFLMIVIGSVCMAVPNLPSWIGIILCTLILALSIVYFLTAKTVGENVSAANQRLNDRTSVMREMADTAQILVGKAETVEEIKLMQKIYDAVKYSDLCSSEDIREEEEGILSIINEISSLLGGDNKTALEKKTKDVLILIEQRNNKCRALKRKI